MISGSNTNMNKIYKEFEEQELDRIDGFPVVEVVCESCEIVKR